MDEFRHLFPKDTASTEHYKYPHKVSSGEFSVPPRDDRVDHGERLAQQVLDAEQAVQEHGKEFPQQKRPEGVVLDFQSDPGFKLKLESLEALRSGIELLNSRMVGNVMHGTVFVPEGKVGIFVRKFEAYANENTKTGKPKNKDLAESITAIRLAALESFWTDAGAFPKETDKPFWWEVWLHEATNPHDVAAVFRERAQAAQIQVGSHEIHFPERCVLLARATVRQWTAFENLFDILAELRLAKTLAGAYAELPPRDQGKLVQEARERVEPPPPNAPSVCHLDTGVNRSHPLLEVALAEEHLLTVVPSWSPADQDGHGTEMAGLALYGDLTSLLESDGPVELRHRLESVKFYREDQPHDPDLYGEITAQAAARIEIAAPDRLRRAFCLTVTADGRDEGYPSSWSGRVDEICAGIEDNKRAAPFRLLFVSAGNVPLDGRHNYPNYNHVQGMQDPAQSWNAVSVGAYTEKTDIHTAGYDDWQPIAKEPGQLSPASSTSLVWANKSWPLKPDIVMEGGNNAIDPATRRADSVDDLMLLTTRVSPDGALLTTTGDTSAATALAARYAAIIWSHYPDLWPETVRGLLVHSARWTDAMLAEFPKPQRHNRLRCYGYGVPDLQRALRSVSSSATQIIECSLQPYQMEGSQVTTKDMHLHRLPWPGEVLEDLGEVEVRMRITLSYFIEPSPGRRGWTRKHRYQSHGLRFDVKRPLETEKDFHKRISKAARDEDEELDVERDDRNWEIGPRLRSKGSIHSDTWTGTAVELAQCGILAVYSVSGWWRDRKHLGCWDRQARYSLIVTIETDSVEIDLYTPIAAQISVPLETKIET